MVLDQIIFAQEYKLVNQTEANSIDLSNSETQSPQSLVWTSRSGSGKLNFIYAGTLKTDAKLI